MFSLRLASLESPIHWNVPSILAMVSHCWHALQVLFLVMLSARVLVLPSLSSESQRRLILVRHGQTDWNLQGKMQGGGFDIALNANGRQQAQQVADALAAATPIHVMASSHLQRARVTAETIWKAQQEKQEQHLLDDTIPYQSTPISTYTGFGEMRFGTFEGLSLRGPDCTPETTRSFQEINNRMKQDKTVAWPEGESTEDVEHRARAALDQVLSRTLSGQTACVVAHGRTNNILLASLLKGDGQYFYEFHQENCCINVLDQTITNGSFEPVLINYNDFMGVAADSTKPL